MTNFSELYDRFELEYANINEIRRIADKKKAKKRMKQALKKREWREPGKDIDTVVDKTIEKVHEQKHREYREGEETEYEYDDQHYDQEEAEKFKKFQDNWKKKSPEGAEEEWTQYKDYSKKRNQTVDDYRDVLALGDEERRKLMETYKLPKEFVEEAKEWINNQPAKTRKAVRGTARKIATKRGKIRPRKSGINKALKRR